MPTNEFLTIANDPSANVESQVAYAADADRTVFFPDGGIPDANQHGKMFRQVSAIIRAVAQAICDITGLDMLDDGNSAVQLASFKTMLQKASAVGNYAVSTGSANAYVLAFSPPITVRKTGLSFKFKANFDNTSDATLDYGAGAISLGLPASANAPISGFIISGRVYTCVDDGAKIQISEVNAMLAAGDYPVQTTVIPNDAAAHVILSPLVSFGGGELLVSGDDGAGNAFTDTFPFYAFSNNAITFASNVAGSPGTRAYTAPIGGTSSITLTRTGGPANMSVTARLKSRE